MRVASFLVIALACFAAARADTDTDRDDGPPASCGAAGLAGGWSPISGDEANAVAQDIADVAIARCELLVEHGRRAGRRRQQLRGRPAAGVHARPLTPNPAAAAVSLLPPAAWAPT